MLLVLVVALVGVAGYFALVKKPIQNIPTVDPISNLTTIPASNSTPTSIFTPKPAPTPPPATSIEYKNAQYGFVFELPLSWGNYSIIIDKWEGYPLDVQDPQKIEGSQILIRHPLWTSVTHRQDIPIMIFTIAQWNLIEQEKLSVGAAPIPPSELGRNATYVFALPARYNFDFLTGYEEVEEILQGNPLKSI